MLPILIREYKWRRKFIHWETKWVSFTRAWHYAMWRMSIPVEDRIDP